MRKNHVETVVGALVLVVAAFFLAFAYSTAELRKPDGYALMARFDRADGLRDGGEVRMSGIKIGSVTGLRLDPKTYLAIVDISIDRRVKLPADTSAQIVSDGLLGGKYLALVPGGAEANLAPGAEIEHTQGSVDVVALIGQLMFSQTGKEAGKDDKK